MIGRRIMRDGKDVMLAQCDGCGGSEYVPASGPYAALEQRGWRVTDRIECPRCAKGKAVAR